MDPEISNHTNDDILVTVRDYPNPPFGKETYAIINIVVRMVITSVIAVFGMVSNTINIVVFYRLGILSHSCNVSLTTIALSDFCFCVLTFWGSVCLYLHYFVDYRDYGWVDILFYICTSARPSNTVSEITRWITAFVGFERAISVVFPFKVKAIFSPKRSCVAISIISIVINVIYVPVTFYHVPKIVPASSASNYTMITFVHFAMPVEYNRLYWHSRIILRVASIIIVVLCNLTITYKVHFSQRFRQSKSSSLTTSRTDAPYVQNQSSSTSSQESYKLATAVNRQKNTIEVNKEIKLFRMITVICSLFIVCYMPDLLHIGVFSYSNWKIGIDYHWITDYFMGIIVVFFLTLNSSCNIFIFYNMSTRYREELQLLLWNKKK